MSIPALEPDQPDEEDLAVGPPTRPQYPVSGVQEAAVAADSRTTFRLNTSRWNLTAAQASEAPQPEDAADVNTPSRSDAPDAPTGSDNPPPVEPPAIEVGEPSPDGDVDLRLAVVTADAGLAIPLKLNRYGQLRNDEARREFAEGVGQVRREVEQERAELERVAVAEGETLEPDDTSARLRGVEEDAQLGERTEGILAQTHDVLEGLGERQVIEPSDRTERVVAALDAARGGESWDADNAALNMRFVAERVNDELDVLGSVVAAVDGGLGSQDDILGARDHIVQLAGIGKDMAEALAKDSRYQDAFPRSIAQQFQQVADRVGSDPHGAGRAVKAMTPAGEESDFGAAVRHAASAEGREINLAGPLSAFRERTLPDQVDDMMFRDSPALSDPAVISNAGEVPSESVELLIPTMRQPSPDDIAGRIAAFRRQGREPDAGWLEAIASSEIVGVTTVKFDWNHGIDHALDEAGHMVTDLRDALQDNATHVAKQIHMVEGNDVLTGENRYPGWYIQRVAPYVNRLDAAITQCRELEPGSERTAYAQEVVQLAAQMQEAAFDAVVNCYQGLDDPGADYRRRDIIGRLGDAVPRYLARSADVPTAASSHANQALLSLSARECLDTLVGLVQPGEPFPEENADACLAQLNDLSTTLRGMRRPELATQISGLAASFAEDSVRPEVLREAGDLIRALRVSGEFEPTGNDVAQVLLGEFRDDPAVVSPPERLRQDVEALEAMVMGHFDTAKAAAGEPERVSFRSWVPGAASASVTFTIDKNGHPSEGAMTAVRESARELWRGAVRRAAREGGVEYRSDMTDAELRHIADRLQSKVPVTGAVPMAGLDDLTARGALGAADLHYRSVFKDARDLAENTRFREVVEAHRALWRVEVESAAEENPEQFVVSTTDQLRDAKVNGTLDAPSVLLNAHAIDVAVKAARGRFDQVLRSAESDPTETELAKLAEAHEQMVAIVEAGREAFQVLGDDERTRELRGHAAANELNDALLAASEAKRTLEAAAAARAEEQAAQARAAEESARQAAAEREAKANTDAEAEAEPEEVESAKTEVREPEAVSTEASEGAPAEIEVPPAKSAKAEILERSKRLGTHGVADLMPSASEGEPDIEPPAVVHIIFPVLYPDDPDVPEVENSGEAQGLNTTLFQHITVDGQRSLEQSMRTSAMDLQRVLTEIADVAPDLQELPHGRTYSANALSELRRAQQEVNSALDPTLPESARAGLYANAMARVVDAAHQASSDLAPENGLARAMQRELLGPDRPRLGTEFGPEVLANSQMYAEALHVTAVDMYAIANIDSSGPDPLFISRAQDTVLGQLNMTITGLELANGIPMYPDPTPDRTPEVPEVPNMLRQARELRGDLAEVRAGVRPMSSELTTRIGLFAAGVVAHNPFRRKRDKPEDAVTRQVAQHLTPTEAKNPQPKTPRTGGASEGRSVISVPRHLSPMLRDDYVNSRKVA